MDLSLVCAWANGSCEEPALSALSLLWSCTAPVLSVMGELG